MKDKANYVRILDLTLTNFPLTQRNLITALQKSIEDNYTILDVGCGMKTFTRHLACKNLTGIDIWEDYLVDGDILGDVRELDKIIIPKSYDVVLAIDLIEHLETKEGHKLIADMINVAKKKVLIMTPMYWSENKELVSEPRSWSFGNFFNYHKSFWGIQSFIELGFVQIRENFGDEFILVVREIG